MANKKTSTEKERKRYTLRFSLPSLLLSCIGFLFILGWIFTLGIMVGRGFLPQTIDAFSFFKKKEVKDEEQKNDHHVSLIKEEDLTFYDQLIDNKDRAKEKHSSQSLLENFDKPKKELKITQKKDDVGGFSIQVAALKDIRATKKMVESLSKSGYPVYSYRAIINGEVFYRIRCGPFHSLAQAKQYVKRLAEEEGFKPFIVYPNK
jgi:hypothetical protein